MGEKETIKLVIHYGGNVRKESDDYKYIGELGCQIVHWKLSEIGWAKFEAFVNDENVSASISLIWFKKLNEEMKKLTYVFENTDDDMFELCIVGQVAGEIEVFLEHACSEHIRGVVHYLESSQRETDYMPGSHDFDDNVADDDDDEVRPREDDEPQESDDATAGIRNEDVVDEGDDVVIDAGDGGNDERFTSLFEEGEKCKDAFPQDGEEKEEEAREAEESDHEYHGNKEYPDTPVESADEWDQWTNIKGGKGEAKFHGDVDKEPYIWLFQKFNSGLEFKDQLLRYSLKTQYDVKMAKSEATRIAAICCEENCKWRVFCSIEVPLNKWMVKVCHNKHNHAKSSRVSMLKQSVIAGLFREELRRNGNLAAAEIKDTIKARYNIVVPISKCYRGRRIALDSILQGQSIQFAKLWDYEAELRRSHRGITTELCTIPVNGVHMFDCFYICFDELRRAWMENCRPVIGLDGCFLKWELNGDVLAAVGRDADNRMFPIAWAVVRGENKDTWGWFVKKLKADLNLRSGDDLTIISDKQKGLVNAIGNELPNAEHRMCARHIYANWKKDYSRSEYKTLFWGVAYSYTEGEFEEKMQLVKAYDPAAYEALLKTEPHKWCRAFFSLQSHCQDVHNNLSEAFNRTIKIARSKPILSLLEDIRRQAMRRISRRCLQAEKCDTILTPTTMTILEKARINGKYCSTIRSSSNLYEVVEFGCGYTVSLSTHQCACRRWDLTGIPCKHAICVLDDNKDDPVKYVSHYYSASVMKNTYAENIKPVNGQKLWKKIDKPSIGIPECRKPRGRPKKRDRKKEPFEDLKNHGKATRHGRTFHCSRCGQGGHIKRVCKNDPVVVEGPKNRRGRPRKHLDEVTLKHCTHQRKRSKTTSDVSSTQPLQPAESSASYPAASSAPQPSLSSKQTKPKRGRQLPITKTRDIPKGVATLMSPFTDRPFDGFNNKATSSEPPQ